MNKFSATLSMAWMATLALGAMGTSTIAVSEPDGTVANFAAFPSSVDSAVEAFVSPGNISARHERFEGDQVIEGEELHVVFEHNFPRVLPVTAPEFLDLPVLKRGFFGCNVVVKAVEPVKVRFTITNSSGAVLHNDEQELLWEFRQDYPGQNPNKHNCSKDKPALYRVPAGGLVEAHFAINGIPVRVGIYFNIPTDTSTSEFLRPPFKGARTKSYPYSYSEVSGQPVINLPETDLTMIVPYRTGDLNTDDGMLMNLVRTP